MKIFEVDSVDELKDGSVATQVDEKGNPVVQSAPEPVEPQETKE